MELTLPCTRCAPNARIAVDGDELRCLACGSIRTFVRKSLHLVTGAPGTGKSSIVPHLAGRAARMAVFDTDLFGPWSNPDWAAWANSWLLLAHALAQSDLDALLVGYGISRRKVADLSARNLLGSLRVLNLDLDPEVLRERLRRRGTYDAARIERKVMAAAALRDEADVTVDVTNMTPDDVADRVLEWLTREGR